MAQVTDRRDGFGRPVKYNCGRGTECPVCNPDLIGDATVAERLRPYVITVAVQPTRRSRWAERALNRSRTVKGF